MFKAKSMSDVIRNNRAAGYHFFDQGTMDFFSCRVESSLFKNNTFVTSEELTGIAPRKYTVRLYDPDTAQIKDVSGFQKYDDLNQALEAARAFGRVKS